MGNAYDLVVFFYPAILGNFCDYGQSSGMTNKIIRDRALLCRPETTLEEEDEKRGPGSPDWRKR